MFLEDNEAESELTVDDRVPKGDADRTPAAAKGDGAWPANEAKGEPPIELRLAKDPNPEGLACGAS